MPEVSTKKTVTFSANDIKTALNRLGNFNIDDKASWKVHLKDSFLSSNGPFPLVSLDDINSIEVTMEDSRIETIPSHIVNRQQ